MASSSAPSRDYDRGNGENLPEQFHHLTDEYHQLKEIFALPPSYESLTESTELINQIDQWETETIRQVKDVAEQTRKKIRHRSEIIATDQLTPEFQQLTEQFQRINQHSGIDLQRLTRQLTDLKLQVEDCLLSTPQILTTPIDWTTALQITTKHFNVVVNQSPIHFDHLLNTRARLSLDVRGGEWHVLGTVCPLNCTFLHYQHIGKHKYLSLVDMNGEQKSLAWHEKQSIWDSCWSSYLNRFLILGDNRLYTYSEGLPPADSIRLVDRVRPKMDRMEFLRCACSNETLFISYDERNTSIDEYNINQWTIVHRYENIVQEKEIIISLAVSERHLNTIGMIILDERRHWYFQVRNRSMSLLSTLQLDKSEFNRLLISLSHPTMSWLIIHTGSKMFTVTDENAQTKQVIECAENMDSATYSAQNKCLVVLTQKNKLKFFDL